MQYYALGAGTEDAVHLFCVNEAFTTDELPEYLNRIAEKYPQYLLFYDLQSCSSLPCHNTIINHIQKRGVTVFSLLGAVFLLKNSDEKYL